MEHGKSISVNTSILISKSISEFTKQENECKLHLFHGHILTLYLGVKFVDNCLTAQRSQADNLILQ